MRSRLGFINIMVGAFAIFCFFLAWHIASSTTRASLFSQLQKMYCAIFSVNDSKIGKYTLPVHTLFSLKRVLVGFGLSSITGVIVGVAMGYSKTINAAIRPLFNIIRPIPGLAWIPMAILWFGIGETTKHFIIFMGGFANVVLNSYDGTSKASPTLIKAAQLLGASNVQVFFRIILPSATPYIFAGLQVSLSTRDGSAGSRNDLLLRGRRVDHKHGNADRKHTDDSGGYGCNSNSRFSSWLI